MKLFLFAICKYLYFLGNMGIGSTLYLLGFLEWATKQHYRPSRDQYVTQRNGERLKVQRETPSLVKS